MFGQHKMLLRNDVLELVLILSFQGIVV